MLNDVEIKQRVGRHAADKFVGDGMRLGLGAGTTLEWVLRGIGARIRNASLHTVHIVVASYQLALVAHEEGVPLLQLDDPIIDGALDLAIDGADEVAPQGRLIKGGGGAMLREKVLAYGADRMIVVVDESKLVPHLGTGFAVPVEVLPFAYAVARRTLEGIAGKVRLRMAVKKMGPVITDNGNLIFDLHFDTPIADPKALESQLNGIPGAVANGLFAHIDPDPIVLVGTAAGHIDTR